jgi:transposase
VDGAVKAETRGQIALALVAVLTALRTQIRALEDQLAEQLQRHPDAAIFTSLPKAGTLRAARLLAEIGDARGRFPPTNPHLPRRRRTIDPPVRQGQARSSKVKVVSFRSAVDKQLRGAVIDFAGDSHHANPWTSDLYQRARARGHDHPHATRILARPWLHITWRCWQDHLPYQPDRRRGTA